MEPTAILSTGGASAAFYGRWLSVSTYVDRMHLLVLVVVRMHVRAYGLIPIFVVHVLCTQAGIVVIILPVDAKLFCIFSDMCVWSVCVCVVSVCVYL